MTVTMTEVCTRDAVANKLLGVKRYRCEDCERFETDNIDHLAEIDDLRQRVSPGEVMPAGECPECGSLIHGGDQDLVNSGMIFWIGAALRRLGWTVVEPTE